MDEQLKQLRKLKNNIDALYAKALISPTILKGLHKAVSDKQEKIMLASLEIHSELISSKHEEFEAIGNADGTYLDKVEAMFQVYKNFAEPELLENSFNIVFLRTTIQHQIDMSLGNRIVVQNVLKGYALESKLVMYVQQLLSGLHEQVGLTMVVDINDMNDDQFALKFDELKLLLDFVISLDLKNSRIGYSKLLICLIERVKKYTNEISLAELIYKGYILCIKSRSILGFMPFLEYIETQEYLPESQVMRLIGLKNFRKFKDFNQFLITLSKADIVAFNGQNVRQHDMMKYIKNLAGNLQGQRTSINNEYVQAIELPEHLYVCYEEQNSIRIDGLHKGLEPDILNLYKSEPNNKCRLLSYRERNFMKLNLFDERIEFNMQHGYLMRDFSSDNNHIVFYSKEGLLSVLLPSIQTETDTLKRHALYTMGLLYLLDNRGLI